MDPIIHFTDSAAAKVKLLIEEEENPNKVLRVAIQGGGCSGFKYHFSLEDEIHHDDTVIEKSGVKLIVDAMSRSLLLGAEIDYREDMNGEQFIIRNPNAKTTCGCGSSFASE